MMNNVTKAIVILLMVLLVMGIVVLFIDDKKPQKITADKNNTSESIKEAIDKTETLHETNDVIDTPILLDTETNNDVSAVVNNAVVNNTGKESSSINSVDHKDAGSESADQNINDSEDTASKPTILPGDSQESNTDKDAEEKELPDLPAADEENDNLGVNELPFDKLD